MFKNIIIAISFICAVCALVLNLKSTGNKSVYVDTGKIYTEFELSKDLNKKLEENIKMRKSIIDSLYEKIRQTTQEIQLKEKKSQHDIELLATLEQEFDYKREKFEKETQAVTVDYNGKIWNQVNQYLLDYGKANHLDFIFGATGQGNIMYGKEESNITDLVIKYINDRYEDKLKK